MLEQSPQIGMNSFGEGQLQIGTCQQHLPVTEQYQQGHLPPASAEIEPCAAAVDL